jgi:hypothetical protein
MTNPLVREDVNIRSPRFFLARTTAACGRCGGRTSMFGFAVPPGHEVLELDDATDEALAMDSWRIAACNAFLFHVAFLPAGIVDRLGEGIRSYRLHAHEGTNSTYWANHCEQCGAQLDDQELFCEPEGGFLPTNELDAGLIELLSIEEPFEAAAAGYAYDPQFFDFMSKA